MIDPFNITESMLTISNQALSGDISREDYNDLAAILCATHYSMSFSEKNQDLINFYFRDEL